MPQRGQTCLTSSSLLGRHTLYRWIRNSRRFDVVKTPQMMFPLELTQTLTAPYLTRHESSQPTCTFLGHRRCVVEVVVLLGRLGAWASSCLTLKVATFQTFEHPPLLGCDAVSMGNRFPTFRREVLASFLKFSQHQSSNDAVRTSQMI